MRIALTVNGRRVSADVEPRTHLADFLREELNLTGTHIGCEHGICGACTVELNGEIARSCITYAVCCDGAEVRTIEGFDDDRMMQRLRRAFTEEHALQCGYCTPGMLLAARDLLRRERALSRAAIRVAMSGNLCRCTGYVGIIRAIARVMAEPADDAVAPKCGVPGGWLGPAPGPQAPGLSGADPGAPAAAARAPPPARQGAAPAMLRVDVGAVAFADGTTRLTESFELPHPREAVWALMADAQRVARCLPGVSLDGPPQGGALKGRFDVGIGPITASFTGTGSLRQVAEEYRQIITASGGDRSSGSRVSASIDCALFAVAGGDGFAATRVAVTMSYVLTGRLAQIGRPAIVRDLARRIGEAFAANLAAELRGGAAPVRQRPLAGGRLLLALLVDRLRALFAALRGRGDT